MTQSDLAKQVKVTTQAVSKWENGGTPDALILYDVSQALGVSIDALYGLSDEVREDHLKSLGLQIAAMNEEERMEAIIRDLLVLLAYAGGQESMADLFENFEGLKEEDETFHLFNMAIRNGFAIGNPLKDGPYLFISANEENAYDARISDEGEYRRIFSLLAKENVMKTILLLLHQPQEAAITTSAIALKLGMKEKESAEILEELEREGFIVSQKVITQEGEMKIWIMLRQTQILSFLMIINDFLEKTNFFTNMSFLPEDFRFLSK